MQLVTRFKVTTGVKGISTARNSNCGKVMFSQAFVCSGGGVSARVGVGGCLLGGDVCPKEC